jgi:hypothetical protein
MPSLVDYYNASRAPAPIEQPTAELGEALAIAAGTGAALAFVAAVDPDGLGFDVSCFKVPIDGAIGLGLGAASVSIKSPELRIASLAAIGAASARTFSRIFMRAPHAGLDFDANDIQLSGERETNNRLLVEAASGL